MFKTVVNDNMFPPQNELLNLPSSVSGLGKCESDEDTKNQLENFKSSILLELAADQKSPGKEDNFMLLGISEIEKGIGKIT